MITLLALIGVGTLLPAQTPVFRTGVETVRVDALVTRNGRPVADLGPADFEVLDNGVLQRIDHAAFEDLPVNVVLVIDASSSVQGDRARRLQHACERVFARVRGDDQVGLVVFGDAVVIRSALTRDLDAVRAALEQPLPPGQTAFVDAAETGILMAESQPGRALVIVLSDGIEVSSFLSTTDVLETVRRSDAVVYGVSLRDRMTPPFLGELANLSGGVLLKIASPAEVEATFDRVLEEFRHRYLLSYAPAGVGPKGWHQLRVRVKQRGMSVTTRPGYYRQ